jgi:hypothetical protein
MFQHQYLRFCVLWCDVCRQSTEHEISYEGPSSYTANELYCSECNGTFPVSAHVKLAIRDKNNRQDSYPVFRV